MAVELRDYQIDALKKLRNGSILNGGVGSGKSITSIAYYFCNVCKGDPRKNYIPMKKPIDLYIITTARKRDDFEWEGELAKFLLSPNPENSYYKDSVKVVIDSWQNIKKYRKVYGAFFIFDEQRVVGKGAWVKSFLEITKKNKWILLSATPGDKWEDYIPVFIANGYYKNRTEFLRRHAVYSYYTKFPKIVRYMEEGRLIRLRNEILVKMDYHTPAHPNDTVIHVSYDRIIYRDVYKNRVNPETGKPFKNISQLIAYLRKIVNSDQTRSEELLKLLNEHPKAIIFYNYDFELEILRHLPYQTGTIKAEYNGHKHEPVPKGDRWVYFVQYTSGSEAWNCIETDTIIFYSDNYSYRTMIQAAGRIDRANTPFKELYYYHFRSASTIDLGIAKALKEKRTFNETKWLNEPRKKNMPSNEEIEYRF